MILLSSHTKFELENLTTSRIHCSTFEDDSGMTDIDMISLNNHTIENTITRQYNMKSNIGFDLMKSNTGFDVI